VVLTVLAAFSALFALAQALDPIAQGTELLMSYFPISVPRAQRQLRLQNDYGFTCRCECFWPRQSTRNKVRSYV
jgi:hypothetical protein